VAARGRPRSFDVDEALDRAIEVFWTHGYAGASLDLLSEAMGIARPSLYAAFGDKEALYVTALARFTLGVRADFRAAFAGTTTIRAGTEAFFEKMIARYTSGKVARGCLAFSAAAADAATHPNVRAALAKLNVELDEGFARVLEAAQKSRELPKGADPKRLARLFAATLHTLGLRARAGTPREELNVIAADAVAIVFG
jgi:AcrR family transcriptional regulator